MAGVAVAALIRFLPSSPVAVELKQWMCVGMCCVAVVFVALCVHWSLVVWATWVLSLLAWYIRSPPPSRFGFSIFIHTCPFHPPLSLPLSLSLSLCFFVSLFVLLLLLFLSFSVPFLSSSLADRNVRVHMPVVCRVLR